MTPARWAKDRSNNYTVTLDTNGHESVTANGREFDTGITTPNGGLNAPLGDLVRWVAFLTSAGAARAPQILSRSSLEEMWRPVVAMNAEPRYLQYMGLSFFLDQRTGRSGTTTFIGHTGSQAGFRAFVEFNPTNRKAVIAALNTSHASGHSESETDRAHRSRDGFNALREQAFALLQ
ncbi:MAG: hypothetical protein DMF74_11390 [Acidobacteria bacterium]|nr:MAG: hypothetical protein DMF74_11390 [Acidobacteriota bacterium]